VQAHEVFIPIVAIISLFVVLPGMVLHYLARNRQSAAKAAGDPAMNARLVEIAERLERRLDAIESLLDHEMPGWKKSQERRNA
jgi:phage shock protein B